MLLTAALPACFDAAVRGISLLLLVVTMPLPLWLHVLASTYAVQARWSQAAGCGFVQGHGSRVRTSHLPSHACCNPRARPSLLQRVRTTADLCGTAMLRAPAWVQHIAASHAAARGVSLRAEHARCLGSRIYGNGPQRPAAHCPASAACWPAAALGLSPLDQLRWICPLDSSFTKTPRPASLSAVATAA